MASQQQQQQQQQLGSASQSQQLGSSSSNVCSVCPVQPRKSIGQPPVLSQTSKSQSSTQLHGRSVDVIEPSSSAAAAANGNDNLEPGEAEVLIIFYIP
jgi:hypothetical protein